jgi:cytochrome c biogenesis protein CcmG/thiol:disulfide interchange protein DsbE
MRVPLLTVLLLGSALLTPAARAVAAPAAPPAPAFSLPTDSGTVSSKSLQGKVVLVDFWASWCGPCQMSFPWLASMQERYADQGLRIVAINLDKDHAAAENFLDKHPAPFAVAFDPLAGTAKAYHVSGMPTTVLIGPDGGVLYSHVGFDAKRAMALEEQIRKAVGS